MGAFDEIRHLAARLATPAFRLVTAIPTIVQIEQHVRGWHLDSDDLGTCYICVQTGADSRDHLIPLGFIHKPILPNINLVTLPAHLLIIASHVHVIQIRSPSRSESSSPQY